MKILGVKIDDIDIVRAVHKVEQWLGGDKLKIFTLVTPNPEIIVQAQGDRRLRKIINEADLSVADGVGLRLAGTQHTVAGVELMGKLCRLAAERGWVVGLYGGRRDIAKKALSSLQEKYPRLTGWAKSAPFLQAQGSRLKAQGVNLKEELRQFEKKIIDTNTRLLFVGLGVPKQEFVIDELLKVFDSEVFDRESQTESVAQTRGAQGLRLRGCSDSRSSMLKGGAREKKDKKTTSNLILMAVGGSFDEIAGRVRAAPERVSRAGLKWLWRLFWQPWRIKRQLRLLRFVYLVLKDKLSNRV